MDGENVVSYQCEQCGKSFRTGCSLRAHQHRNHSGRKFICYHCRYQTNFKHVLQKHIGAIHFTLKVNTPRHKCPLCNVFTAPVRQAMLDHYNSGHNLNVSKTILKFDNDDDFCRWKREREKADSCQFVLSKGGRRTDQGEFVRYFRCSRDGYSRIKRTGKRRPKKKGSVKTNCVCPCSIKVVQTPSGLCRIEYVPTHVGHTCDVGKLQLSQQERDDIAQKLAARVPVEAILGSIRESKSHGDVFRLHLATRKDLRNIMRRLHDGYSAHPNDRTSVGALIKTTMPDESSPETDVIPENFLQISMKNDDPRETAAKANLIKQPGIDLAKCKQILTNSAMNIIDSIQSQEDFAQAHKMMMMIPPTLAAQRNGLIFSSTSSIKQEINPCANVSPQKSLFSTRKKKDAKKPNSLCKPTEEEKETLINSCCSRSTGLLKIFQPPMMKFKAEG